MTRVFGTVYTVSSADLFSPTSLISTPGKGTYMRRDILDLHKFVQSDAVCVQRCPVPPTILQSKWRILEKLGIL